MLIPRLKLQDFSSLRKILQDATEMLNSNKANLSSIVGGRLPDFLREYVVGSVNEKRPSNTADRLQLSEISPSARSSEVRLLTRSKAPGFEKPGLLLNRVDQGRSGTALRIQPCYSHVHRLHWQIWQIMLENFRRLVFGCLEADFCNQEFILQHL